jgi:hypothetical protein
MNPQMYKRYLKGLKFVRGLEDFTRLNKNQIMTLGRVSYILRLALTTDMPRKESGVLELNYAYADKVQSMSKEEQSRLLSPVAAWYNLYKRLPKGIKNNTAVHPAVLDKVMLKTFGALMKNVPDADRESMAEPAIRLAYLFRDMGKVNQWLKSQGGDIHDAGQFLVDELDHREQWGTFLIRFPDLQYLSSSFRTFEKEFKRMPVSKKEFVDYVATLRYSGVSMDVGLIAAKYKCSQKTAELYEKFFSKTEPKNFESIPNIAISLNGYSLYKMDAFDKEGPFLGLATDCCQHLESAGADCAKAGYQDGESAFYVITKGGNIVAQSWVWRNKDVLVMDSIEAKGQISIESVASLINKLSSVIGKLGISSIHVGDTSYGITKDIIKTLGLEKVKAVKAYPNFKDGYSDAKKQVKLV